MRAEELIIYSDMDGTMITDWDMGPYVPKRNLEAMRRFMKDGGAISIASGRQIGNVEPLFPGLCFNAPGVFGNGTVVQSFQTKEILHCSLLSPKFKAESVKLAREHEFIYLLPGDFDRVYQVNIGDSRDRRSQGLNPGRIEIEEYLSRDFVKMVFVIEDENRMPELKALVSTMETAPEIQTCESAPIFLETFSREAGKARGVRLGAQLGGFEDRKIVCIGDYFNDEEMLRRADLAACPANAPEEIKAICQIVTCSNNEGAVADLIEKLLAL